MGKRGPKAKPGKREANGRLSRKPADVMQHFNDKLGADEREVLRTGVEARMRVHGVNVASLRDTDAGTFVGRLRISGEISDQQCEAAHQYCAIYERMQAAVGGPKPSGAVNLNATKGMPGPENTAQAIKARDDWGNALKAVQDRQNELRMGAALIATLDYCVLRDEPQMHMVGWLREGLNALARHFKLGDRRKAA